MTEPTITRADLIERIARAWCASEGLSPDQQIVWDDFPGIPKSYAPQWRRYAEGAEAALDAIHDADHAVVTRSELPESVRSKAKEGTWESLVAAADLAKEA